LTAHVVYLCHDRFQKLFFQRHECQISSAYVALIQQVLLDTDDFFANSLETTKLLSMVAKINACRRYSCESYSPNSGIVVARVANFRILNHLVEDAATEKNAAS
jgi:hypothetical protein